MTLQHSIDVGEREVDLGLHIGREGLGAIPATLARDFNDSRGESNGLRVVVCLTVLLARAGRVGGVGKGGHIWEEICEI